MNLSTKSVFLFFGTTLTLGFLSCPVMAWANEGGLPEAVTARLNIPLEKIGHGTYRKLGFTVYDAALWATQNRWDSAKPYALQLHYKRSISKETLVDTVMDDIADQGLANEQTQTRWRSLLNDALRDVEENDVLVGFALPGQSTLLFFNGVKIASINDPAFSTAFFGIWLGNHADESLRAELLGLQ